MAFHDDIVDNITSQITSIGLSKTSDSSGEVTGGGYAALTPTFTASSGGVSNLTDPLVFNGPPEDGPITHLIFRRAEGVWVVRAVAAQGYFNTDGVIHVTSVPITSAFGA